MARNDKNNANVEKVKDEFEKKTVSINRVTKVVKGGRKMKFSALVVTGDKKGRVGIGMAKGAEVSIAIERAGVAAKHNLLNVAICEDTIPHEVIGVFEKTKVIMLPAKEGNGVIAGGAVRDVVELAGIKNITTKLYGSNNPVNCVKATIDGLKQLRSREQIAALRGKKPEEI